jgi:hypothetical protein
MSWLLAPPPKLSDSLPEWLSAIARSYLHRDLSSFTDALGYGPCTKESLFYDPPQGFLELLGKKTSVPIDDLTRRTAAYMNEFTGACLKEANDPYDDRRIGIEIKNSPVFNDIPYGRSDYRECPREYIDPNFHDKIYGSISDELSSRYYNWIVVIPETRRKACRWLNGEGPTEEILYKSIVKIPSRNSHPSLSSIHFTMNVRMAERIHKRKSRFGNPHYCDVLSGSSRALD